MKYNEVAVVTLTCGSLESMLAVKRCRQSMCTGSTIQTSGPEDSRNTVRAVRRLIWSTTHPESPENPHTQPDLILICRLKSIYVLSLQFIREHLELIRIRGFCALCKWTCKLKVCCLYQCPRVPAVYTKQISAAGSRLLCFSPVASSETSGWTSEPEEPPGPRRPDLLHQPPPGHLETTRLWRKWWRVCSRFHKVTINQGNTHRYWCSDSLELSTTSLHHMIIVSHTGSLEHRFQPLSNCKRINVDRDSSD